MKKILTIISVIIGMILLAGCNNEKLTQIKSTIPVQKTQPITKSKIVNNSTGSNALKEYKSAGTFSFKYPSQVCDPESKKCYSIKLIENNSSITLDAQEGGSFSIDYVTGITSEKSINNFLQTNYKNKLCKVDSTDSNILEGTSIQNTFLDEGCSLRGPKYEKFLSENPDAVGIAGKQRAYWSTNSKEFILYVIGAGGGCAFLDCNIEEQISESINLDGINVFQKSMQ